jgi:uncharacterized membrane protein YbhN (UPF0104 family)
LALALWSLRQAGLRPRTATRTLLTFLVLLYSVFLSAIVLSGGVLALGLVHAQGPAEVSATAALIATFAIVLTVAVAVGTRAVSGSDEQREHRGRVRAIRASARVAGEGVRQAVKLIRSADPRLAGAVAYWAFDAAVLWAMLRAFGAAPVVPVVVLAYFVGQVANTLPIPGSVSGGIAGVLVAFGVAPALAIPAVLAYRTVAVWLPTPAAIAAMPALRATAVRWRAEAVSPAAVASA